MAKLADSPLPPPQLLCQARSLIRLQEEARSAEQDGLQNSDLRLLASCGCNGRYPNNVERDMHRRLRKKLQISVQPFMVKTELLFGTFRNSGAAVAMLLPHEMFADICTKMPALAAERICGAPGTAEDFWDLMKGESWMATHPLRERLLSSNPPTPLRTWGDDCALGKSGYTEARVMNWCSCVGTGTSMEVKIPIYILSTAQMTGQTEGPLLYVIAWSFFCLMTGVHPSLDPWGEPWPPNTDRAKKAGSPLPYAAVVQIGGDWKYLQQIMHMQNAWSSLYPCFWCKIHQNDITDPNAQWEPRTTLEYMLEANPSPLASQPGWDRTMVVGDVMHDDMLGVRQQFVGSAMLLLARERHFWGPPAPHGTWQEKLQQQLSTAYTEFKKWVRDHGLKCSQTRFKPSTLRLTTLGSWPEANVKAHNCAIISLWICACCKKLFDLHADDEAKELAMTANGFKMLWEIYHDAPRRLTDHDRQRLETARVRALCGFNSLSQRALNTNRFFFHVIPKYHKLDHTLRFGVRTALNPSSYWTFADEDWIGWMSRLAHSCHSSSMMNRAIFRWQFTYYAQALPLS